MPGGNMTNQKEQSEPDAGAIDEKNQPAQPAYGGAHYEIRVKGHLSSAWSDWLEGLQVKLLENGETVLSGIIVDQAALMGILNKLIRLNLTLLSVYEIKR
jgi:hypothetical protein